MRQHPTARIDAAAAELKIAALTAIRQALRIEFAAPPLSFPAKAGIQYSRDVKRPQQRRGVLDRPPSRAMTLSLWCRACRYFSLTR
jgi:hypothetical protein